MLTTKLLADSTGPSDTISPVEAALPAAEQSLAADPAAEDPLPAVEETPTGGLQHDTSPMIFAGDKFLQEPEGVLPRWGADPEDTPGKCKAGKSPAAARVSPDCCANPQSAR